MYFARTDVRLFFHWRSSLTAQIRQTTQSTYTVYRGFNINDNTFFKNVLFIYKASSYLAKKVHTKHINWHDGGLPGITFKHYKLLKKRV